MKKIMLIGCIFLVVFCFTGCGTRTTDELVMVTEAGFAPYEYYDGQEVVGVDVDIAKEIAGRMNKKLVVKDIAFDSIINEIQSGKADFGAAGMSITEERRKQVDFSIEYVVSKQVVLTKSGSEIKKPTDLHGKKVAVQLGTVADSYLASNYKDTTLVQQKKYLAAVEDLKGGKVSAVVMDSLPAKYVLKVNPSLVMLDEALFTDQYGMVVKKGNKKLLNAINEVLDELMDQNKIEDYTLNHLS